jgi:hypothetical protein
MHPDVTDFSEPNPGACPSVSPTFSQASPDAFQYFAKLVSPFFVHTDTPEIVRRRTLSNTIKRETAAGCSTHHQFGITSV